MATRNRAAFTLVELLVVVAIIGVLVGLLMPAIIGARERARVAQCMNYQSELGKAVLAYEMAKKRFPGYANAIWVNQLNGGGTQRQQIIIGWAPMLLPYLGRQDIWDRWRDGYTDSSYVKQFVCPTDAPTVDYPLSYVVNVGPGQALPAPPLPPPAPSDDSSVNTSYLTQTGLFRNFTLTGQNGTVKQTSMTDIRSAARRPMIAESAFDIANSTDGIATAADRQWIDWDYYGSAGAPARPALASLKVKATRFGFLFWPGNSSPYNPVVGTRNSSTGVVSNGAIVPIHSGLVNVFFCDGHAESLNNDPDTTCNNFDCTDIK